MGADEAAFAEGPRSEVEEQADFEAGDAEVAEHLGVVCGNEALDALGVYYDLNQPQRPLVPLPTSAVIRVLVP